MLPVLLPEPEAPLELGEVVLVLGEVVLLPEPLDVPLLLGEVVLPLVLPPLAPLLAVSPARYSLSESLPSLSLSSDLNLALAALSLDEDAPVLEDEVLGDEDEPVLGELALLEELPEEPLLIEPLDWLVLGEAELPLVDLSVLLLLCAWTDAAKAAAMAAAIRVLLFIRESPQGKCCSTGKLSHRISGLRTGKRMTAPDSQQQTCAPAVVQNVIRP